MPQRGRTSRGEQRLPDDVTEIIHFVRNFQGIQRETTEMRLTKKAPLPGIGHTTGFTPGETIDTGLSPRRGCILDNNNLLDNDVNDDDDAAYVSDNDRELDLSGGGYGGYGSPTPPLPTPRRPHPGADAGNANRLSRSLDGIPENEQQQPPGKLQPIGQQRKYKSEPGRKSKGAGHHLPPMERDIPERPTAPRPASGRADRPKSGYANRPRSSVPGGQSRPKSGYGRRREPPRPSAPSPTVTPPASQHHQDSDGSDPIDFIDSH